MNTRRTNNKQQQENTANNQFGQPLSDTRQLTANQDRQLSPSTVTAADRQPADTDRQRDSDITLFRFKTLPT